MIFYKDGELIGHVIWLGPNHYIIYKEARYRRHWDDWYNPAEHIIVCPD